MKIAIVLPAISLFSAARPNSMETVIRTLATAAGPDETIRVFCDAGADDHGDMEVQTIPREQGRMAAMIAALRAWDPDIIEFHQNVQSASHIARRFPRKTRLLYRHNDVKAPRSWIGRWRYGHRHQPFDGFVFVSDASRENFLKDYPSLAHKAFTVRNPIDATLWRGDGGERDQAIVFSGRAMPEKGIDLICAALPRVLDKHPDWRAVLMLNDWQRHSAWAGPHVAQLERFGDRVQVLKSAPLAEVQAVMRRSAIALTPSVWAEPLGLTALEAHAAGAALISSGRGGLREASGPHALYLNEVTVPCLAQAMDALIDNPAERRALACAAQAYVFEHHTPARRAAELADLRKRMLARRTHAA